MRASSALLFASALLSTLFGSGSAHAWTEANVQSVRADVDVDARGDARVSLLLTVRIGGGWLSGLDLDGLDPDLVLDADKPPWAMSADDSTQTWAPTVRISEEGRVRLGFPGRGSPRRGTLLVGLSYTTALAGRGTTPIEDGRVRVSWTLPGWRTGLDNVEVKIATPEGAEVAPTMEDGSEAADDHSEEERPGRSVHVFHRIHLPRTVAWTVSVDLPAEALDPALRGPTVVAPRPSDAPHADRDERSLAGLSMILLVCFVALASRASFSSACRARGLWPRPLLPGPLWLVLPSTAGLATLGQRFATEEPLVTVAVLVTIAALGIQRGPRRAPAPAPLPGRPLGAEALKRARRESFAAHLVGSPLLDLTTVGGAAIFAAAVTSALALGELWGRPPSALALAAIGLGTIPFLAATRFHLPASEARRLVLLRRLAGSWEDIGPAASRLVDGPGLQVILGAAIDGLLRFEVVVADRPVLGGFEAEPVLVVVTNAQSDAETRLASVDALPAPLREVDGVRTRVVDARPELVRALVLSLTEVERAEDAPLLAAA